jgi:hypothetical protein
MLSAEYVALCDRLVEAGAPAKATLNVKGAGVELTDPVTILYSTSRSAKPFENLLVEYGALLQTANELEAVVRALSERGLKRAGPFLVSVLRKRQYRGNDSLLWAAGNGLSTLKDPATYADIVDLCGDGSLGRARQMLFTVLPWTKAPDAFEAAMAGLADSSVRAHAMEALGRFGNPAIIPALEGLVLDKKKDEWKVREAAIRRLRRVDGQGVDDVMSNPRVQSTARVSSGERSKERARRD